MCAACSEYIKDRLTANELKAALREMTVDDAAHRQEVDRLIRELDGNPEELKRRLDELVKGK